MTRRSKKAELRLLSPRSGVSRETARAAFAVHGFRFFKASLQSLANLRLRVPVPRARRAFLHRRLAAVHEVTSRVAMLQLGSLRHVGYGITTDFFESFVEGAWSKEMPR